MRRIEIMGASGVGKTTLYNKLSQLPINNRCYISQKEAYIIAAKNCKMTIRQWNLLFYKYAIKFGIFKNKHLGISKVLLFKLNNKSPFSIDKYNDFIISFNILYDLLKEEKRPYHAYKRIKNFLDRVNEFIILDNYYPSNKFVMIDEGMLKYHPGITDYGIKTYCTDNFKNDLAFRSVAIIYCTQSDDIV
jgi:GTPase SAR1 family protein